MYTNKPIRIHSKCLCILEMIQKINSRIESEKANLNTFDNARHFDIIRLINSRASIVARIENAKEVKGRLVDYYNNTAQELLPFQNSVA